MARIPRTSTAPETGFDVEDVADCVPQVDGDVVTLATPLGDETLWNKRAIAAIEEPPFGSASAHEESGSDVEQSDDGRESEQDSAEPQS